MTKSATAWRPLSGTGDATSIGSTRITTLSGIQLTTLSGSYLILSPSVVNEKDDTIWGATDTKTSDIWRYQGYGDNTVDTAEERVTVSGETRVTVSGDTRVSTDGVYTAKASSIWSEV